MKRILRALPSTLALLLGVLCVNVLAQEVPPPPPDAPQIVKAYRFIGKWMPDVDSAGIGAENFRTLTNLRYNGPDTGTSIEGVRGYTKINTTALALPLIRNGYQLFVNSTNTYSHVLVQAHNSSGSSNVYLNSVNVPAMGNFTSAAFHSDAAGSGLGRFAEGPGGVVLYSNGVENRVWGGNETRAAGFFTCDDASGTNPKDYTDAVRNTLATSTESAVIGTQRFWIVLSTRALQGVRYTIGTANAAAATSTTAKYWNGTAFAAVSNFVDGTASGGITLAQSGVMSFTSTADTAKPYHFSGAYLYAYLFEATAGISATVSQATVDAPWQQLVDVWDGTEHPNKQFQAVRSGVNENYTLETQDESSIDYPIAARLGNCTSTDYAVVMFSKRMAAIKWTFIATATNPNAATAVIHYWNGTAWTTPKAFTDGTSDGTDTMSKNGIMSWEPPDKDKEFERTLYGITGYAYKISWTATLGTATDGDGKTVMADMVTGIPAPNPPPVAKFPAFWRGRAMLCNHENSGQPNRIDYSFPDTTDIWNGELTSNGGEQSLFVGGGDPIVAAAEIFNLAGNSLDSILAVFKKTKLYVVQGDNPENFTVRNISANVGCPAPLTIATCEMGYDLAEGLQRNIAVFLSYSGPYITDGRVLQPLRGIDSYFNPAESKCVNTDAIENARGWYDSTYKEYNLVIPSGAGQTTNNVWLVYDMTRKKWFEKSVGVDTSNTPQAAFPAQDNSGARYIYAGRDDGHMMRLENGNSWDGVAIKQVVETGDFIFGESPWDITVIRHLKLIASRIDEDHTLSVYHIGDTSDDGVQFSFADTDDFAWANTPDFVWESGSSLTLSLNLTTSAATIVKSTSSVNLQGLFHRLRFTVSTTNTSKGFRPVGWTAQGYAVRGEYQ